MPLLPELLAASVLGALGFSIRFARRSPGRT
jgi:hypothetical protein